MGRASALVDRGYLTRVRRTRAKDLTDAASVGKLGRLLRLCILLRHSDLGRKGSKVVKNLHCEFFDVKNLASKVNTVKLQPEMYHTLLSTRWPRWPLQPQDLRELCALEEFWLYVVTFGR